MNARVREVQAEVRLDLPADAPKIRSMGRTRKPHGLRITYGRRADVDRVDLVIEYRNDACRWLAIEPLPAWLAEIIQAHRPEDVTDPEQDRRPGMGSLTL